MARENEIWGHLGILECDECKAKCEKIDDCDGIQCLKFEDSLINLNRIEYNLPILGNKQSEIPAGFPCQWLRKPRKSSECKPDVITETCWKKEKGDDGICLHHFITHIILTVYKLLYPSIYL